MSGAVYHGPHREPYYYTDSRFGIARAANQHYRGIDLNVRTCRANDWKPWAPWRRVIVVTHWSKWWEHGFKPRSGLHVPHRPIEQLKLNQVRDLRSVKGNLSIITANEAVDECKAHGIIPFFELKPSKWPSRALVALRAHAGAVRHPIAVMTIQAYGSTARAKARWERKAFDRLKKAKAAGLKTVLLYRRPFDWATWSPVLDAIKGHAGHGSVLGLNAFLNQLENR